MAAMYGGQGTASYGDSGSQWWGTQTITIPYGPATATTTNWDLGQVSFGQQQFVPEPDPAPAAEDEVRAAKARASRAAMAEFLAAHLPLLRRRAAPPRPRLAAKDRRWRSRWLGRRPRLRIAPRAA